MGKLIDINKTGVKRPIGLITRRHKKIKILLPDEFFELKEKCKISLINMVNIPSEFQKEPYFYLYREALSRNVDYMIQGKLDQGYLCNKK